MIANWENLWEVDLEAGVAVVYCGVLFWLLFRGFFAVILK